MKKENKEELGSELNKYKSIVERLIFLIERAYLKYKKEATRRSPKRNKVLNAMSERIIYLRILLNASYYDENEIELEIFKTIKFLKEQSNLTKISHFNNSYFNFNLFCCKVRLTESRLAKEIDFILNDPIIKTADQEILFVDAKTLTS